MNLWEPVKPVPCVCISCGVKFGAPNGWPRQNCSPCTHAKSVKQERAHRIVYKARLTGKLPDPKTLDCVDCGKKAQQFEHRNYDLPLEVVPVCRSCNRKRGPAKWCEPRIQRFFLEPAPL